MGCSVLDSRRQVSNGSAVRASVRGMGPKSQGPEVQEENARPGSGGRHQEASSLGSVEPKCQVGDEDASPERKVSIYMHWTNFPCINSLTSDIFSALLEKFELVMPMFR